MTLVDNFFPFDTGSGAAATPARWRLMARTWATSGILPRYLNQLNPTIAGSVVTIDTGAVWIDGFYGEIDAPKPVTATGSGMIVVRADPTARQIVVSFVANQTQPTQSLTDIYEIPVCRVATGAITDIRQFTSASGIPPGVMWDFGGVTPPVGWLLCDGTSYLRTDYTPLFNAIQTNYGAVDGTHFSVPDYRGCMGIGAGGGPGLTARGVGQRGGEENHTLVWWENGYHSHGGNGTGGESQNHMHSPVTATDGSWPITWTASSQSLYHPAQAGSQQALGNASVQSGWADRDHIHGIPAEGGQPHNNMPPFVVATKIIKT